MATLLQCSICPYSTGPICIEVYCPSLCMWQHTFPQCCICPYSSGPMCVFTSPSLSPHFFNAAFAFLQGQCVFTFATLLQCCICPSSGPICVFTSPSLSQHFFSVAFALLQGQYMCVYLPLLIATLLQCCICPSSGPMFCGLYTYFWSIYVYNLMFPCI